MLLKLIAANPSLQKLTIYNTNGSIYKVYCDDCTGDHISLEDMKILAENLK